MDIEEAKARVTEMLEQRPDSPSEEDITAAFVLGRHRKVHDTEEAELYAAAKAFLTDNDLMPNPDDEDFTVPDFPPEN